MLRFFVRFDTTYVFSKHSKHFYSVSYYRSSDLIGSLDTGLIVPGVLQSTSPSGYGVYIVCTLYFFIIRRSRRVLLLSSLPLSPIRRHSSQFVTQTVNRSAHTHKRRSHICRVERTALYDFLRVQFFSYLFSVKNRFVLGTRPIVKFICGV